MTSAPGMRPDPVEGATPRHILLVDDEEAILRAATILLERSGFRVTGFSAPGPALTYIEATDEGVDLLLTDHSMLQMTGVELGEAVQRLRPGTPVVVMSGDLEGRVGANPHGTGITALLSKPFDRDTLLRTMEQALG